MAVPTATSDSVTFKDILEGTAWAFAVVAGLAAIGVVGLVASEQVTVQRNLTETGTASMVCRSGDVTYGDGSWQDRLTKKGYFRCTEWRMQTAEALEAADRLNKAKP